jgi:septal ring factor EnvC (AmiA/AmiB activator)
MALLMASCTCLAETSLTRSEAEARLKDLENEISQLQDNLEKSRSSMRKEQGALKESDLAIQASTIQLRMLQAEVQQHEKDLAAMQGEREDYLNSLDTRRKALAEQILAAYRLGQESRLKLVLNQDSPAELSRTLAYYDYLSRAQGERIVELRQVIETLDGMQANINRELAELNATQERQKATLDEMTAQREEKQQRVQALAAQINTDAAQLEELRANRRDLEVLLSRLSDTLADIPNDMGGRQSPADMKGELPMPVAGRVSFAYGQARSAGLQWHGWLIAANSGEEVKSVAYGRVAYADWLRGYGLLMIIDHGDGFMTLYANNESLLHEVGDWVEPGAAISTVGTSAMNGNGLYFEIRRDGKALDPAAWLKR